MNLANRLASRIQDSIHWRWHIIKHTWRMERAELDPRISYPCYKSLDEFVDVEQLKGLNEYLESYIREHSKAVEDEPFFTGDLILKPRLKKKPGSKVIKLSNSTREYKYFDLDEAGVWSPTREAAELPRLMDFIRTLPFKATARMIIMYDFNGGAVTPHRDHYKFKKCHEFIWFRPNLRKPFFLLNHKTGKREYVKSYTAWFDTVNQYHGADPVDGLSISLRVDGTWTDEFRATIPRPSCNNASTPAFWACTGNP